MMQAGDVTMFYGIQVPRGTALPDDITLEPFYTDRIAALNFLKKVKPARMKIFSSSEEAESFQKSASQPLAVVSQPPKSNGESNNTSAESLPYSSLKFQDLVQLKLAIERGNIQKVKERIDSNPRYLIASGDTPTIVQERVRYNSLHCAAIKGKTEIAELILNYLSDPAFYAKLFPRERETTRRNRMYFTLDLYLNTPEKGFNETPLHFAAKYGHVSMVALLVNEPLLDVSRTNNDNKGVLDIVCTRSGNSTDRAKIIDILQGQYYVPLYRSVTDDIAPVVGDPWTPGGRDVVEDGGDVFSPQLNKDAPSPDVLSMTSPLRSAHQFKLPTPSRTPTRAGQRTPAEQMVVKALAGPMSPQQATEFRKNWTAPGTPRYRRTQQLKSDSPLASPHSDISRRDPYKGLEVVGRVLAKDSGIPWIEEWNFLGCSVDICSTEGLEKLERYIISLEENCQKVIIPDGDLEISQGSPNERRETNPTTAANGRPKALASSLPNAAQGNSRTDCELATIFSGLSIHSPSSPNYIHPPSCPLQAPATTSSQTPAGTSNLMPVGGPNTAEHCVQRNSLPTPKRTVIEYLVPSVVPYMDKLRCIWPFGRSHTPTPTTIPFTPCEHTAIPSSTATVQQKEVTPRATVYLNGSKPCKIDKDVLKALEGVDVDKSVYPATHNWYTNVTSFSAQEQHRWESPVALRHRARLKRLQMADTSKRRLVLN